MAANGDCLLLGTSLKWHLVELQFMHFCVVDLVYNHRRSLLGAKKKSLAYRLQIGYTSASTAQAEI